MQRWLKFSKYLPDFGVNPIILTVDERKASYPLIDHSLSQEVSSSLRVIKTNTFEPYSFYSKISSKASAPHSGFANETKPNFIQKISRFVRGNFFIPDSRRGWNKYALKQAEKLIKEEQIDTIITTSPPHSTQLIGYKLKKKIPGLCWVADLRDPWTDIYYYNQFYHTSAAKALDASYEKKVLLLADKLVTVSEQVKRLYEQKVSKNITDKFTIIPNGYDNEDFEFKGNLKDDDKLINIVYTGTMSETYINNSFIDVFNKLAKEYNFLKLTLVGDISENISKLINPKSLNNIGYVPHKDSVKYLSNADLLLLIIPKIKDNEGILTGKLFEYLGSSKSIIAVGPTLGDAASIISECNAGRMFDYDDEEGLRQYLINLISNWKDNKMIISTSCNFEKYSRKNLTKVLADLLFTD